MTTCCFTGHRSIPDEDIPMISRRIDAAIRKCLSLGITTFENGAALGFDTLAAMRIIRMRTYRPEIKLRLMIPCRDQCRNWNSQQLLLYKRLLGLADEVVYLANSYYDGCMRARNYRMVEDSCACICYYNGTRHSGTAQTVHYAEKKGLLILNCAEPIDFP